LDYNFDNPDNDEDEAVGEGEDDLHFGGQHVIALIDCHPDMFVFVPPRLKDEEDVNIEDKYLKHDKEGKAETPFDLSIRTMQKLVETVIEMTVTRKTGKRDGVGILLYNTRPQQKGRQQAVQDDETTLGYQDNVDDDDKMDEHESDNDDDDDHNHDDEGKSVNENDDNLNQTNVHKLLDLAPPGIKQFRALSTVMDRNGRDLKAEFCPLTTDYELRQAPLQNAIEEAMRIFLHSKYVKDRNKAKTPEHIDCRAIWIFTNQSTPYTPPLRRLVENVANEAKEQGIEFIVWPMASTVDGRLHSGIFVSSFFESLASVWFFEKCFQDIEELEQDGLDVIYQRMNRNRRVYHGPMHILHSSVDKEAPMMIDWFSPVQLAKRPSKVQIDDETKL
jgi:hypothetical protein